MSNSRVRSNHPFQGGRAASRSAARRFSLRPAASGEWHTTRSSVDLRAGGRFSSRMEAKDASFGFDFEGTYANVVPNSRLEYSFGDRKARVEFIEGQAGVTVRVSFDSEETHSIEQQREGWQAILDRFQRHVEGAR